MSFFSNVKKLKGLLIRVRWKNVGFDEPDRCQNVLHRIVKL